MLIRSPLAAVFGGSRATVLDALLDVETGMGVREVARLADVSPTTASSALRALAEIGLLRVTVWSRGQLYRVNDQHALMAPLRGVLAASRAVDERVVQMVREAVPKMHALWLYGSRARGDETPASDADLVVIMRRAEDVRRCEDVVRGRLTEALEAILGYPVWISVERSPRLEDWGLPFWSRVADDGVALFGPQPREVRDRAVSDSPGRRGRRQP